MPSYKFEHESISFISSVYLHNILSLLWSSAACIFDIQNLAKNIRTLLTKEECTEISNLGLAVA